MQRKAAAQRENTSSEISEAPKADERSLEFIIFNISFLSQSEGFWLTLAGRSLNCQVCCFGCSCRVPALDLWCRLVQCPCGFSVVLGRSGSSVSFMGVLGVICEYLKVSGDLGSGKRAVIGIASEAAPAAVSSARVSASVPATQTRS